jgi:hypothetical protein
MSPTYSLYVSLGDGVGLAMMNSLPSLGIPEKCIMVFLYKIIVSMGKKGLIPLEYRVNFGIERSPIFHKS